MNKPNIAVILSGCGVADGSEIHESVLTLLALAKAGVSYQCFAPDAPQARVVNHLTGQPVAGESRNMLQEAARIARGKILALHEANHADYDAVILPGGYGAALNLCDFGVKGATCEVRSDVTKFVQAMASAKKPAGFICIAPTMISKIYGPGVKLTIGNDTATAKAINDMGGIHIDCDVKDFVIDEQQKVVTTPAYMLGKSIDEVAIGIEKLVQKVLQLAGLTPNS